VSRLNLERDTRAITTAMQVIDIWSALVEYYLMMIVAIWLKVYNNTKGGLIIAK
jgi:hypothetical protein